jgi:hypothetical protein
MERVSKPEIHRMVTVTTCDTNKKMIHHSSGEKGKGQGEKDVPETVLKRYAKPWLGTSQK